MVLSPKLILKRSSSVKSSKSKLVSKSLATVSLSKLLEKLSAMKPHLMVKLCPAEKKFSPSKTSKRIPTATCIKVLRFHLVKDG